MNNFLVKPNHDVKGIIALLRKPVDNDEWIEWRGGECPVDKDKCVRVEFRSGEKYSGYAPDLFWGKDNVHADIIKYRIVK